jgi:DNA-binding Xre family transcriptional regulator
MPAFSLQTKMPEPVLRQ